MLGADGELSDRTIQALRAADEAGIIVVPATGRSHRTAEPRLEPAGVVRTVVCSNGASVYDMASRQVVLHRPIEDGVGDVLPALLRSADPDACFGWETPDGFGWEHAFVDVAPVHVRDSLRNGSRADELHASIEAAAPASLTKLLVGHPRIHSNDWLAVVAPMLPDTVQVATSGAAFVEVTGGGVDKASTLALACAELDIDRSEVAAFGDQTNDVAMLEWAGSSWAPANAHESAIDAADAVIGHHAEDGVAQVIEDLLG